MHIVHIALIVLCLQDARGYLSLRRILTRSESLAAVSAATTLIKKSKLKENDKIMEEMRQNPQHVISKFLKDGTRPEGILASVDFYTSTFLRYDSVSVMPEYNKKTKTGFIAGMPPPEIMGGVLRDSGARAIVVSMDPRSGGTSFEEFERLAREQSKARKMTPPPIPIVWFDFVFSELQINHAVSLGAAAVTIHPDYTDDLKSLVSYCVKMKIEPIILVENGLHGTAAIEAGARCICMQTMDEKMLLETRNQLSSSGNGDRELLFIARLRPETDFSAYAEIDLSWVLRDNGFHCVWPSPDAVYATGMSDVYSTVLAMRSKASRLFLSPRQFLADRKKEGAQEFLGDVYY